MVKQCPRIRESTLSLPIPNLTGVTNNDRPDSVKCPRGKTIPGENHTALAEWKTERFSRKTVPCLSGKNETDEISVFLAVVSLIANSLIVLDRSLGYFFR